VLVTRPSVHCEKRDLRPVLVTACCLLAFFPFDRTGALEPGRAIDVYSQQQWTLEDGLPQSTPTAIVQGADHYLYIATYGGVVRFDGVRFTDVTGSDCGHRFVSLAADSEGTVWVGSAVDGVCRVEDGRLRAVELPAAIDGHGVRSLLAARDGSVWMAVFDTLVRYRDAGFEWFGPEVGLPPGRIAVLSETPEGELWLGGMGGLCRWRESTCDLPDALASLRDRPITALMASQNNGLWIAAENRVFQWREGKLLQVLEVQPPIDVNHLLEDRHGQIWAGQSAGGLRRLWPTSERQQFDHGLRDTTVTALGLDDEGHLWVGTAVRGLLRLYDGVARGSQVPSAEQSAPVVPIVPDGQGGAYVGTQCQGVVHIADPGDRTHRPIGALDGCVWSLAVDSAGRLWAGTYGQGLYRQDASGQFRILDGFSSPEGVVTALLEDRRGRMLIGSDAGVHRYDPASERYSMLLTTPGRTVRVLDQAPDGSIWIGADGGLLVHADGQTRRLSVSADRPLGQVRAIHRDGEGVVWIGTYGNGLMRLANGLWTVYDRNVGLPENIVSRIIEDPYGRFWMNGNLGVTRVERNELEDYAAGRIARVSAELLDRRDGMPISETNGGGQPAGWLDERGTLWVPTISGVALFDVHADQRGDRPPPVRVETIRVDAQVVDASVPIVLPADARNLEIEYTAFSYHAPDRLRFEYRLEGYDEHWQQVGTRRVAYYPVIPSGRLKFEVRAITGGGVYSERPASFEFERKPEFVNTWGFVVLLTLSAVVVGIAIVGLRQRVIFQRRRQLEREVAERTAELTRLGELAETINRAIRLDDILDHVYDTMHDRVPYDRIGLALLDDDGKMVRAAWSRGRSVEVGIGPNYSWPLEGSSLARVLDSGEPRIIADLREYLTEHPESESTRRILKEGIRSNIVLPLQIPGQPVGFLFFSSSMANAYTDAHAGFLRKLAGHLSLAINKSRLVEDLLKAKAELEHVNRRLQRLADVDGLTAIPNRRAFDRELARRWERARHSRRWFAVMMIDVDHFKPFNDHYGHLAGDDCLRTVASALADSVRQAEGLVARVGGEEFAVVLDNVAPDSSVQVANRVCDAIRALRIEHRHSAAGAWVTVSIGLVSAPAHQVEHYDELIRAADQALYQAKRSGRNRVVEVDWSTRVAQH